MSTSDRRLAELLWQRRALSRELLAACLQRAQASQRPLRQVLLSEGHLDAAALEQAESALVRPRAPSERAAGPGGTLRLDSDSDQRPALGSGSDQRPGLNRSDRARYPGSEATQRDRQPAGPAPARSPSGPQLRSTRRVGPYELTEELGRGGMGAVYRARDTRSGQVCALKTLHAGGDEEDLQRFRREADLAWQLDHPGIVRVLDVGSDGALRYLVLELLEGGSLQSRLSRQGPLPIPEAIQVGLSLADALAHAHAQGVLHRDLKPANVIFDAAGKPKLADFGLAQGPSGHSLTTTGSILGTPAYMAPEQARDSKRVDERTDVYGLGALLYGVISGRPPVVAASLHEALLMLEESEAPPLRSLCPAASPELEALFKRVLARDPAERYPSVVEFAAALRSLEEAPEEQEEPRRSLFVPGVLALAAMATGAGLVLVLQGPKSSPEPSPSPEVASATPSQTTPSPTSSPTDPGPQPSASAAPQPSAWGPLPPQRGEEPVSSAVLIGLQAGGGAWEGALTWVRTRGTARRALTAYVRHELISSDPWRARVQLLRLRALDFEPRQARIYESNAPQRRGALPLLREPQTWGTLEVTASQGPLWTPKLVPLERDDEFSAWIRARLSEPYWGHWVQAFALKVGSWGDAARRGQGQGLEWASWPGQDAVVSFRRIETKRVVPGKAGYLSVSHRETYPALVSFNDLASCNVVHEGELFEEPRFPPPTGGVRATLGAEAWVWTAPHGWPRARISAPRDVVLLDRSGTWRRIQWGAGYGYVKERFLEESAEQACVEVLSDSRHKGVYPWVRQLSPDPSKVFGAPQNGVLKGQRFVVTGNQRGGHTEVYFDHRRGWIPNASLREVTPSPGAEGD